MTHFIYVFQSATGAVKIGYTRDLADRLTNVQVGNDEEVHIAYYFEVESLEVAEALEALLHKRYETEHKRGEWFTVSPEQVASDLRFVAAVAALLTSITIHTADNRVRTDLGTVVFPDEDRDPLYLEAVMLVKRKPASISILQNNLHISYQRASRLLVELEKNGVLN